MTEKNEVYNSLLQIVHGYPGVRMGITDISYSEYSGQFNRALVFAVPHDKMISLMTYSEEKFENVIRAAREVVDRIISDVSELLQTHDIVVHVPPTAQSDEKYLIAPFSFKFAAVNAGLGWIGKNGVLVTREYGPRVRLSAVLLNYALPAGTPVRKSMCPEDCFVCVNSCPYNALKGIQWNIHKYREDIIDYQLCNFKRSQYLKTHGRKNACGLCIAACPLGTQKK
jgi:epoxyqueuosine reductase QueG